MQATDETYDSLTSTGIVVVAFHDGGIGWMDGDLGDCLRAIELAAEEWGIPCVLVDCYTCVKTQIRLRVIGYPTLWLLKDGVTVATLVGHFNGGHPDSLRLNHAHFNKWLVAHIPA